MGWVWGVYEGGYGGFMREGTQLPVAVVSDCVYVCVCVCECG